MSFSDRLQHAWNAFFNKDPTFPDYSYGISYSNRPDRVRFSKGNERSIITAIFNRISTDVASISIKHVKVDENQKFVSNMNSTLNDCLTVEANVDQTGKAFIQDVVESMLDEGCVAIVPTDTSSNPYITDSFKINELRTGKILQWYPKHVRVSVYNENKGQKEEITCLKSQIGIIENPFYSVMNEQNSTLKRLIHKLNILDAIDEQSGSGKLNMIVQLPYAIKTETRKEQAEQRRKDIELQLVGSKYGIAYIDSTEKVTQLNRSLDNNLMTQIEYLTKMLYSQLGITETILDGTANEATLQNYYNRTVDVILTAIVDEMKRKFLTKTARSQGQSFLFFRDPFKLVPISNFADMSDKFSRNEIMTTNEIRSTIGMVPSQDPKADELRNKNISAPVEGGTPAESGMTDEEMLREQIADPETGELSQEYTDPETGEVYERNV